MLVEFTVENFLSFKEPATLSMVASSIKELRETNTYAENNLELLKSAVIYGANASGKSNLFSAMAFMKEFILESSKENQINEEIAVDYFRLDKSMKDKVSTFEMVFILEGIRYRYGFSVTSHQIEEEWLFSSRKNAEKLVFYRDEDSIELGSLFKEGKGLESKTRKNALFLSVAANFNGEISTKLLSWFGTLNIISGSSNNILEYTKKKLEDKNFKERILNLLKIADIDIADIAIEKIKIPEEKIPKDIPNELKKMINKEIELILTERRDPDGNLLTVFNAENNESQGTIKLLSISAPIIDTIENGRTLIIDELDAKFHPLITQFIIEMFNSDKNKNAQLIFNTHDTNHLTKNLFRRDQIWFAEKDEFGCSELYSLVEYKQDITKVRNDATYNKNYLMGRYGAIPYVGNLELLKELMGNGIGQSSSQKESD
ncbi:AAA family ATPase [Bacillus velezensis]|uniref:AAA family ATPase n=1 Tax=Bacillus velezensis TaxID=492670 RepID=UPI00192C174D|nr:ATP-binding protein [Bacillus velezensis]QQY07086.1 ATP-binding protein [Bacillus velezensis]